MVMTTATTKRPSAASSASILRRIIVRCAVLALTLRQVSGWTNVVDNRNRGNDAASRQHRLLGRSESSHGGDSSAPAPPSPHPTATMNRREGILKIVRSSSSSSAFFFFAAATTTTTTILTPPPSAFAYTPDADPLRESLYLMSRVQEATVQQERFVRGASRQDALRDKMKLTLRLVEKNYRLLDQITYASEFIDSSSSSETAVVDATAAGYEAAEALQNAIDYVNEDLGRKGGGAAFEDGQKEYLTSNLAECRERLFDFLAYMPQEKLEGARRRVEEENVANRDEFDGDSNAGVYNPVVLPWKNR